MLNKLLNQQSVDRRSPRCYCVSMDEDREYDVEADEDTERVFTTLPVWTRAFTVVSSSIKRALSNGNFARAQELGPPPKQHIIFLIDCQPAMNKSCGVVDKDVRFYISSTFQDVSVLLHVLQTQYLSLQLIACTKQMNSNL